MGIIILAIWVLWAYLAYQMAEKRNRDPRLGALAGFLFGPIALFYYLLAGKKGE